MLFRDCAGGVVFCGEKVFLLKNEKDEWVLPKGRIRDDKLSTETAIERVKIEAGIDAQILLSVGETHYEFYSNTRRVPVANRINWYIMEAADETFNVNKELQYQEGGYFLIEEAIEKITYSQDKGLLSVAVRKYRQTKTA